MKIYEKEFTIPQVNLWHIQGRIYRGIPDLRSVPIRFVVTENKDSSYKCEVGIVEPYEKWDEHTDIFYHQKKKTRKQDTFNTVLIIPTGIGAEIGGHAGDGNPVAKQLQSNSRRNRLYSSRRQ